MKKVLSFFWEVAKIVVIALLIVIPIRYFLFQPFFVKGQSMEPNFEQGDYLIIDELSYRLRDPQRGEVIVFNFPQKPSQRYIKRIIGLPGETIEIKNNQVIIYNNDSQGQILDESGYLSSSVQTSGDFQFALNDEEYFVMGDNRPLSSDSRRWGVLPKDDIVGRVLLRAWPPTALAKFEAPVYE